MGADNLGNTLHMTFYGCTKCTKVSSELADGTRI